MYIPKKMEKNNSKHKGSLSNWLQKDMHNYFQSMYAKQANYT